MVWGLLPIDSLRGAQKYYIFSAGTYRVGRKDCDVVVQTDTSISRVHAEIIVDEMVSWDPSRTESVDFHSNVRIVDRSKYGTSINKESGAEGSRMRKDQEVVLKHGDLVTFGTGNATFRLSFVPIITFLHGRRPSRVDPSLQAIMISIGAYTTRKWSHDCTHALVDESSPVTLELIEAVLARKQIVSRDWFKVLAEQNIRTEIPSCAPYVPNLSLDGTDVKSVDAELRESCLVGYTFILGSAHKYKFGEKLNSLLEVSGAKFLQVEEYCSNSQTLGDGDDKQLVLVVPTKSMMEFNHLRELSSLPKVTDLKLVAAILSGRLEAAVIEPPSFIVSSSHSTDETIVADSDVEIDTATSDRVIAGPPQHDIKYEDEDKNDERWKYKEDATSLEDRENNVNLSGESDKEKVFQPKDKDAQVIERKDKIDDSIADRHENSEIIFSQDLIVRSMKTPAPVRSDTKEVNFKCFRKRETVSGNSFKDLIPFSKDPYKESDYGSNESSEYIREERKRKQMEAIAEDLFNNEKARKRASAGTSIHALLASR
ncbi:nibrin homolog [Typha latifolia]|uniref:nibrin homolog n=1 Tax=Typha latifolia TaxID=4733 RepID=UPI003C2C2267